MSIPLARCFSAGVVVDNQLVASTTVWLAHTASEGSYTRNHRHSVSSLTKSPRKEFDYPERTPLVVPVGEPRKADRHTAGLEHLQE